MEEKPCEAVIREIFKRIEERYGSVEEFAKKIAVSPNFLRLLKEERWDDMPEAIYVKAFIKKIAGALGMDAERVIDALYQCFSDKDLKTEISSIEVTKTSSRVFKWFSVVLIFALIGVAAGLFYVHERLKSNMRVLTEKTLNKTFAVKEVPASSGNETKTQNIPSLETGFTLSLKATGGDSWYRWVNGDKKREGFIRDGEEREFMCARKCLLKLGRPSVVSILFGGKLLRFPFNNPCLLKVTPQGIEVLRGGR